MERVKYGRTFHLPGSPGVSSDDKVLKSVSHFVGKRVIVTTKMDGECTTCYADGYMHARSIDGNWHESRDWVKANIAPRIAHQIPASWRICGENLYARHSIAYTDLPTFFMVFSIWGGNTAVSWDETVEWCRMLDLHTVPILYDGMWDEKLIYGLWDNMNPETDEGFVVRVADQFTMDDFATSLAKWVRAEHVQTEDKHWKRNWKPNSKSN